MRYLIPLAVLLAVFSAAAYAKADSPISSPIAPDLVQDKELSDPGLTPDSSFYFLKTWKESIQTFFTFGAENKAKQYLHLAEVRLAEYQKMIERGKSEIAQKTLDKYEKQLNQAVEKAQEAQKKGAVDLTDMIKEKRTEHQKVLGDIFEKTPAEIKEGIINERRGKWIDFITEVREKFPGLIPEQVSVKETLPEQLLRCPIPAVPLPEDCEGGWQASQVSGCPYFSCPSASASKREMSEPPKPAEPEKSIEKSLVERPVESVEKLVEAPVCIQVITPAIGPDKKCKEFPTPCEVPAGWKKVDKCPTPVQITAECQPYQFKDYPCPDSGGKRVYNCNCVNGKWSCPSIESACPTPSELRYYTCPDGTKVVSGECFGEGERLTCSISSRPEIQCPQQTPPVTRGAICSTINEVKYYQCEDGTKIPWCVCSRAGGEWADMPANTIPINKWQCQYYSLGFTCLKPTAAPTPVPTSQPVACYIQKDCVSVESKDDCLKKGGSPSSESSCPTIASPPIPPACTVNGIKDYKCPDGTLVKWQCSCGEDSWSCKINPAIFCPGLRDTTSLIISDIWIRDMFWTEEPPVPNVTQGPGIFHFFWGTSKPATSYVEYGPTDAYGLITPESPTPLDVKHTNNAQASLKGGSLYHFRIVATDAQGNTAASEDSTFTSAFNFSTIPGTVQPYIRLLGPGISPTYWKIGGTSAIVWEARGVNKVNIDLVMFDSNGNRLKTYSIAKSVSSSGATGEHYIYSWQVPSNSEFLQAGYKFKIIISDPTTFVFGLNDNDLFIQE